MNKPLSLFNWSLKNLLLTETGSFNIAKLKILFTILIFSLVKALIVVAVAWYHEQYFQLGRALGFLLFYIISLKLLLANKAYIKTLTHTMICAGILIIWSNIFISAQAINIITLQFTFMVMLSSFYLLNSRAGIWYSLISIIPILYFLVSGEAAAGFDISPGQLAAPGNLLIVTLNFLTMMIAHYLYHEALNINIREKEDLNTRLKEAVKAANTHAQSKSDFLSTMSHELRTPLNSVIGMTDLLLDDPHSEEQKENLRILRFSAVSLHTLINDILDFNKLDSDKLHLEMIPVHLDALMHTICSGLELQAKEKGLNLVLEIDEALKDQHVVTDPTRITQIIYNLAGNGIKFTGSGSVTVSLKLVSRSENKLVIRFAITDTGIGISADQHEGIFEPFVQASTHTTRNYGGTGLGLSIVKRLLALLGSGIHLESTPGSGSTFFFEIGFIPVNTAFVASIASTAADHDLTGLRVLIAEDNQMNIFLVRKLCSRWHIDPVIVKNGIEAVDELKANPFDVILMDIHMPDMDGYEATRVIRNMPDAAKARIPIIALTASVSHDVHLKIKAAGMDDYVSKPFNANDLYDKLKRIAKAPVK